MKPGNKEWTEVMANSRKAKRPKARKVFFVEDSSISEINWLDEAEEGEGESGDTAQISGNSGLIQEEKAQKSEGEIRDSSETAAVSSVEAPPAPADSTEALHSEALEKPETDLPEQAGHPEATEKSGHSEKAGHPEITEKNGQSEKAAIPEKADLLESARKPGGPEGTEQPEARAQTKEGRPLLPPARKRPPQRSGGWPSGGEAEARRRSSMPPIWPTVP